MPAIVRQKLVDLDNEYDLKQQQFDKQRNLLQQQLIKTQNKINQIEENEIFSNNSEIQKEKEYKNKIFELNNKINELNDILIKSKNENEKYNLEIKNVKT